MKITLNPDAKNLNLKAPYVIACTWFGAGLLLPAPGTWGSLAALPVGLLLLLADTQTLFTGILLVLVIGLISTRKFQEKTGTQDSKMIVIDEVVGQWIPLLFCKLNPILILLAFLLFRLFDILKPWPISWFDKNMKDERGVMFDDIAAGVAASIVLILIRWGLGL